MSVREWLFSYGTLRDPAVQAALFGRQLQAIDDALVGFCVDQVRITDVKVIRTSGSDVHPILRRGAVSDRVAGAALRVTPADLAAADRYEVADYRRVPVVLASGRPAYAYLGRDA
jgi:hypothetical protein